MKEFASNVGLKPVEQCSIQSLYKTIIPGLHWGADTLDVLRDIGNYPPEVEEADDGMLIAEEVQAPWLFELDPNAEDDCVQMRPTMVNLVKEYLPNSLFALNGKPVYLEEPSHSFPPRCIRALAMVLHEVAESRLEDKNWAGDDLDEEIRSLMKKHLDNDDYYEKFENLPINRRQKDDLGKTKPLSEDEKKLFLELAPRLLDGIVSNIVWKRGLLRTVESQRVEGIELNRIKNETKYEGDVTTDSGGTKRYDEAGYLLKKVYKDGGGGQFDFYYAVTEEGDKIRTKEELYDVLDEDPDSDEDYDYDPPIGMMRM